MKVTNLLGYEPENMKKRPMTRFEMDCTVYYLYQLLKTWEEEMGVEPYITIERVESDTLISRGEVHVAEDYFYILVDGKEVAIDNIFALEEHKHDLFAYAYPLNEDREPLEDEGFLVRI